MLVTTMQPMIALCEQKLPQIPTQDQTTLVREQRESETKIERVGKTKRVEMTDGVKQTKRRGKKK